MLGSTTGSRCFLDSDAPTLPCGVDVNAAIEHINIAHLVLHTMWKGYIWNDEFSSGKSRKGHKHRARLERTPGLNYAVFEILSRASTSRTLLSVTHSRLHVSRTDSLKSCACALLKKVWYSMPMEDLAGCVAEAFKKYLPRSPRD